MYFFIAVFFRDISLLREGFTSLRGKLILEIGFLGQSSFFILLL